MPLSTLYIHAGDIVAENDITLAWSLEQKTQNAGNSRLHMVAMPTNKKYI